MEEFGFRQYDPALARWIEQDPIDNLMNMYTAMGNNPVSMIDPNGAKQCAALGSATDMSQANVDIPLVLNFGGGGSGGGMSMTQWACLSPGEQLALQLANGTTYGQLEISA